MYPVFVCRLLMRMMNERGQDERSLDSSLRDNQTKAEQIETLRTVATRLGSVKYFVLQNLSTIGPQSESVLIYSP